MEEGLSYGYLPPEYAKVENAEIVVIPVAYDGTSTWIKGADKGPDAIIDASANMELYDIETDSEVYRRGIFTEQTIADCMTVKEMIEAVADMVTYYLEQDKFPVTIGGEHSVTIGALRAFARQYENLSVLQLDAHADLRDEYEGSKYNHACVMARARELCPIVQVGIRSMDATEKESLDSSRVFFARDIVQGPGWAEKVVEKLSGQVYVTIDLDVFDSSVMPSTGTPEPGGLSWYDVIDLARLVFQKTSVVGFDVVELCPNPENRAPDFLAAKLVYKLLSYKFKG